MSDFLFLKPYMRSNYGHVVEVAKHNVFREVTQEEILEAEQYLGFPFPPELRAFYEQIGYGYGAVNKVI